MELQFKRDRKLFVTKLRRFHNPEYRNGRFSENIGGERINSMNSYVGIVLFLQCVLLGTFCYVRCAKTKNKKNVVLYILAGVFFCIMFVFLYFLLATSPLAIESDIHDFLSQT